jgi:Tfp pilus assembly protein PilF
LAETHRRRIFVPRIEDIEQFKAELNSLGHEPSILAERGERLEDVPMPASSIDEDLDALLNVSGEEAAEEEFFGLDTGEDRIAPAAQDEEDDFSIPEDLLAGFDIDAAAGDEGAEEEIEFPEEPEEEFAFPEEQPGGPPAEEEFGLPEGFAEEEEFGLPEDLPEEEDVAFPEEQPGEPPAEEEFGLPEGFADEEEFGLPEGLPEEEEFAFPEEQPGGPPAEEEFGLPEGFAEEEEFGLPEGFTEEEDFSLPEEPFEGGEPASADEEEFEIPEEFAAAADILSMDEETGGEEAEGEAGGPEFAEDAASFEESFQEDEDFSLPDESEELSFSDEDAEEADFSMPDGFPFEEAPAAAEAEDFSLPEGGAAGESGGGFGEEFEIPSAGDIEDIDEANFEVDEFSLGDLGEQFGEIEEGPAAPVEEELNPALAVSGELPSGDDELDLDDGEFERLQETLNRQPLNLRIAIEELIGEKNLAGTHLQKLVRGLVEGASSKELAVMVGAITGKKIRIPSRYEKSTGEAFEAEKGTFAYAFRHNILPLVRVIAAVALILGILSYLSFTFIYRPVHALILYNAGYEQLEADSFREANLFFENAVEEWRYKNQYFRFAEGFIEKRQFTLAEQKYEELLFPVLWRDEGRLVRRPQIEKIGRKERQGILDYAAMESRRLENFEKAEELLEILLDQDKRDYDALLASGDNYLDWGEYEYGQYENARKSYATLIQYYGGRWELLFRMLRYFIRTDNHREVVRLKEQFEADPKLKIEPDAYAELGGYLIDRNDLGDVKDILTRALDRDRSIPEIHYHFARYFRRIDNPDEERKALDFAEYYLEEARPLGRGRLKLLIDTYDRQGEADYEDGEYLSAEEYLLKAQERYEDALERRVLEPEPMFGRIYRNLGNLYYYIAAEFDRAFDMFTRAEESGYRSPELNYKKGYIHYNRQEYRDALAQFYLAADGYSVNENLLFATGNALFRRSDYFAAQGYFTHLLDELEQQRRNISVLLPQERQEDRALIDRLIRTHNNLGVTLQRLSLATGDRQKFSRALVHLTDSTEYFDLLSRDQETMERGSAVNLGFLNQRAMLYPVENYELQIYAGLPLDLETLWME